MSFNASVLRKNVPVDATEEELLEWVLQSIRSYSLQYGFTHRQVWRIFDAGLAAKHCLTAPMVDGYDSPFSMEN